MKIGLIRGRHAMPVDRYLLDENITNEVGFHGELYKAARQAGAALVDETGTQQVLLHVTGLTNAALGAVDGLRSKGARVSVASFDRDSQQYVEFETRSQ